MKRVFFLLFLLITILIAGCQNNAQEYKPSSEDVLDMHGKIENMERFEEFFNNVNNGRKDTIRVVRYTTEGDPHIHDLEYDGEVINATYDTTKGAFDKEGSINTGVCTSIDVVETPGRTEYLLNGCEDYDYAIFTILDR